MQRSLRLTILAGLPLGVLLGALVIAATSIELMSRARWMFTVIWSVLGLLALCSLACLWLPQWGTFRQRFPDASFPLRRAGLFLGVPLLVTLSVVLLFDHVFEPLKFQYVIQRVESARTSQEERAAFELAARWGHVWELNRLTKREWLPERAQHLRGDWVLELEWLESSAWTSKPFRAYRVVVDEKNLAVLQRNERRR